MTESNRSLDDLPALIAERKKFESWLSALEARRDVTAPHVFDRVRTDYLARLQEVDGRLSGHRSSIVEEKTSLESRRSLLQAEEQMRRDERTELELRAHVGELIGAESDAAFGTVDEALAKMGVERDGLTSRIHELDGFLELSSGSQEAQPAPVEVAAPAPVAQTAMDLNAQAIAPKPASVHPAPPPPPPDAPAVTASSSNGPPAAKPPTNTPADPNRLVLSEHSATFLRTSGQMPDIDEVLAEPPGADHHGERQPTKGTRLTPGGRFDELAFLSDVVGLKPDAPASAAPPAAPPQTPLREEPPKSPLEGLAPARPSTATPPLASNVGNTPIVLRASGAISQSKTLKCTECGAMNYPTEWYCERCGAELAAL